MLSQQNPNAICESNSAVVKRLFSLCYTCIYGKYYVAYGIPYRYIHSTEAFDGYWVLPQ